MQKLTNGHKVNLLSFMSELKAITSQISYAQEYQNLKSQYHPHRPEIRISELGCVLRNIPFRSKSELIFPADLQYYAPKLSGSSINLDHIFFEGPWGPVIRISDQDIEQNKQFSYILLQADGVQDDQGVIFMFHGLNEKDWSKYLPWAKRISELTRKSVILFPIAFHINRAHPDWHRSRMMNEVSQRRKHLLEHIEASSFTNAAMSTRLHFAPSRFFLSGLETYLDVIQLVQQIRQGQHPFLKAASRIDFFGYSAGAFLAQIILMANREELFTESKAVLFCGGALLNRMHLCSRYIMDNAAHQAILDYYTENFDHNLNRDPQLKKRFDSTHRGGAFFRSMLSEGYSDANALRRKRFEELQTRIFALLLTQDEVMPPTEVQASLMNSKGQLAFECKEMDFDYPYSHFNPFPEITKIQTEVDRSSSEVFAWVAERLAS